MIKLSFVVYKVYALYLDYSNTIKKLSSKWYNSANKIDFSSKSVESLSFDFKEN